MSDLIGAEVGAAVRIQLLFHTVNVPKHPKFDDLLAVGGKKSRPGPSDLSACRLYCKELTAVQPLERHARRRANFCRDQVFDDARVAGQGCMDGTQVVDEPVRSPPHGTERTAEAKVRMQNLARDLLIGSVPNVKVEPFNQCFR